MNARALAHARLAARAFPAAWRAEHLDEFVDTVDELTPGEALPWRTALDIVLAGWGERLRNHPPLGRWLGYSLLGLRLPERWHVWVRADVEGRWYWLRRGLRYVALFDLVWMAMSAVLRRVSGHAAPMPWSVMIGPLAAVPVTALVAGPARRHVLRQHGLLDRSPVAVVPYVAEPTASAPVAELAGLAATAAGVFAVALLGRVAFHPHRPAGPPPYVFPVDRLPVGRPVVALLAMLGLVVGAVLAKAAVCAVGRRTVRSGRPDATGRERRRRRVGEAATATAGAALTWQATIGRWPDHVAVMLGAGALAIALPGAALAWAAHRRSTPAAPFTWADLVTSASTVLVTFDGRGRPAAG